MFNHSWSVFSPFSFFLFIFWIRSSQPAGSTPTKPAAVRTLSGEAHARCRRHPERLRLGLHSLSRTPVGSNQWSEWDELRDKNIVGFEPGRPALNSNEDNLTESRRNIFLSQAGLFFFLLYKWLTVYETIIKREMGQAWSAWAQAGMTNMSSVPTGLHVAKVLSSLWIVFLCSLSVFLPQVCPLSAKFLHLFFMQTNKRYSTFSPWICRFWSTGPFYAATQLKSC